MGCIRTCERFSLWGCSSLKEGTLFNTEEQLHYFPWSTASTHKASFSLQSAGVWHVCEAWSLPSILTHLCYGAPRPPPTKPNIKTAFTEVLWSTWLLGQGPCRARSPHLDGDGDNNVATTQEPGVKQPGSQDQSPRCAPSPVYLKQWPGSVGSQKNKTGFFPLNSSLSQMENRNLNKDFPK